MLRALLAVLLVMLPISAFAQFSPNAAPVRLVFSPEHPRPYDQVTVTLESNLINLSAADLVIYVNGAIIEEGSKTATFRVGAAGTKAVVRATATTLESTESAEATLTPADVALIIEPFATAHPFYEGGLLVPSEGRLRIVALADMRSASGARLPETDISYSWKVGDKQLAAESGFGRNVLTAEAPPRYRDSVVTVTAISRDRSITAKSVISVSPVDPLLRIYPYDPLSGTSFSTALTDSFSFSSNESGFRVVPYFFKETPSYSWKLNSVESGTQDHITVRSGGGSGSATLSVDAMLGVIRASESATLRFDTARSTGFFGF